MVEGLGDWGGGGENIVTVGWQNVFWGGMVKIIWGCMANLFFLR